jgi:hypothetical protein
LHRFDKPNELNNGLSFITCATLNLPSYTSLGFSENRLQDCLTEEGPDAKNSVFAGDSQGFVLNLDKPAQPLSRAGTA